MLSQNTAFLVTFSFAAAPFLFSNIAFLLYYSISCVFIISLSLILYFKKKLIFFKKVLAFCLIIVYNMYCVREKHKKTNKHL